MTFLGSRFFEKGRRSGSCFDVQSSMMRYSTQAVPNSYQNGTDAVVLFLAMYNERQRWG
jgi:hypothetical protein